MKKKDIDSCFDVTMGIYDDANTSDLVGTYLISPQAIIIDRNNSGLYLDGGIIFFMQCDWAKNGSCKMECNQNFHRSWF